MTRIKMLTICISILAMTIAAFAGNYRLPVDGTGKFPVTEYGPQSNIAKKSTAVTKGAFKNFTTSDLAAVKCTTRVPPSTSAAGAATAIKVRFGGYTTGNEAAHYVTAEDTYWNPPTKIGFKNYTGIIDIHCSKQP